MVDGNAEIRSCPLNVALTVFFILETWGGHSLAQEVEWSCSKQKVPGSTRSIYSTLKTCVPT